MRPSELNVDQTVQLVSEQFEIALNGSEAFKNRGALDTASIATGLLDDDLVPETVVAVSGGRVDEVELHVAPDKMTSVVRGRNAAALAVDSTVLVTFLAGGRQEVVGGSSEVGQRGTDGAGDPNFPTIPNIPGVTVPLILPGPWTASGICRYLATLVGLGCVYQANDYTLREDFPVSGPISQAIGTLVEPFSHFESSKVDIWAEGSSMIVRKRGAGGTGLSLDVHDARITDLAIRARFLGYIRVVRLTGSSTGKVRGSASDPGSKTTETVDEFEQDGVVSRIVTTETVRVLDHAVLSQVIDTYLDNGDDKGLHLVSTVDTSSEWDPLVLVYPNQVVNSPKEKKKVTLTSSLDESTNTFHPTNRVTVLLAYDSNGFMTGQDTKNEDFDAGADSGLGAWSLNSRETKTYRDNGLNMYMITSTQYDSDGSPTGVVHRTTANGSRPGGPGRGASKGGGAEDLPPVTLGAVVSLLPGARDFTLTNKSLLPSHLRVILAQAVAESGATEVEISFTAAGVPWMRRGQYITLEGLDDELGYDIPLQPALVTECRLEYRESSANPTYTTFVKATFWEKD